MSHLRLNISRCSRRAITERQRRSNRTDQERLDDKEHVKFKTSQNDKKKSSTFVSITSKRIRSMAKTYADAISE